MDSDPAEVAAQACLELERVDPEPACPVSAYLGSVYSGPASTAELVSKDLASPAAEVPEPQSGCASVAKRKQERQSRRRMQAE